MAQECDRCSAYMDVDAEFDDGTTRYECPRCGATAHETAAW